ncbi:TPA: hypothetical protein EYP66_09020 [Candidatus Poribacteria bacterium]|nr:hypothetical protein [Candidatus Poribacteria bacterium]
MAKLQDLPALIAQFWELAREYLLQETVGQAKKLGRFAGYSIGAAALWSFAAILIGVAALRGLVHVMPDGPYWEALGYLIAVIVFIIVAAIIVKAGPSSEPDEPTTQTGGVT